MILFPPETARQTLAVSPRRGLDPLTKGPQLHVRARLDPLPACANQPGRSAVRRRLRTGEPRFLLALGACRMAVHRTDDLVRLFLPRPGAGDAGARRHRGSAGGW